MVQTSSVVALLYVLDVCAWVIMLGGVAAWQYQCNTSTDASVCLTAAQQLAWWAVWFQFFVLIFLFVVYFSRQAISYRVSLMTLLAMVTTLMFTTTNYAFDYIKTSDGGLQSATQASAAGSIIAMICNMLLIIVVGGDLADAFGSSPGAPAVPMSHQAQDPAVQLSSSYNPAYGTKPAV